MLPIGARSRTAWHSEHTVSRWPAALLHSVRGRHCQRLLTHSGRSLRERNEEIKRLKKQVEKLEETQAQSTLGTPLTEPDVNAGPSLAHSGTAADPDSVHSAASAMSTSDWMGEYLGMLPQTPGSDHDSFAGLSHHDGQVEAWASAFPSMGVAPDSLLQPVTEHEFEHAITANETIGPVMVSRCPQYHGEACKNHSGSGSSDSSGSSSITSHGSYETFTYSSMPLSPDGMSHTRGHTMRTGDSTPSGSPTLRPFTFGNNNNNNNNTQGLRAVTSRLNACGNKDIYRTRSNSGKTSPFSSHTRLEMETGTRNSYNEGCNPVSASPHRSPTSSPWCSCKPADGSHTALASDVSVRGARHAGNEPEYERQRTLIRPLDMDSLYTQGHFLHQGLLVGPSDCGDGVTIRLQPTATSGRASLVAFMIQREPSPDSVVNENQIRKLEYDDMNRH